MDEEAEKLYSFVEAHKAHFTVIETYRFVQAVSNMKALYQTKCAEAESLLVQLASKRN